MGAVGLFIYIYSYVYHGRSPFIDQKLNMNNVLAIFVNVCKMLYEKISLIEIAT